MRFSISLLSGSAAALGLALFACGGDGPTEPPSLTTPAAIALVSGNHQEGKAGEQLTEPFAVRVTDARGDGVPGVEVTWLVTSGAGAFQSTSGEQVLLVTTATLSDPDGIARVFFRPTPLGPSSVAAVVVGLEGSPVTFTTDATVLLIRFRNDPIDGPWFAGPEGSSDITVPVGTTVEWAVEWAPGEPTARLASTSKPPGGEPFDSGILRPGERFQFVLGVAGTWEYVDQFSGGSGTLTAQDAGWWDY